MNNGEKNNLSEIQKAFSQQAERFNEYQNQTFKNAFTERTICSMELQGNERVLEIAAGTCALGRMIAPHVFSVTELDITPAMLEAGKKANEKAGITNAEYVIGNAEELPFDNGTFDIVVSRLAFHHFANPENIMAESVRVLKPGGKIGVIDMIPPDEKARETFDHLEILRDPSHTRCLTLGELSGMAEENGLRVTATGREIIPMDLISWMGLTETDEKKQKEITDTLIQDLQGGVSSGMSPYLEEGRIMFHRHWAFVVAIKA